MPSTITVSEVLRPTADPAAEHERLFRAITIVDKPEAVGLQPGTLFNKARAIGYVAIMPSFKNINRKKLFEIMSDVADSVPVHYVKLEDLILNYPISPGFSPNRPVINLHRYFLACLGHEGAKVTGLDYRIGRAYTPKFTHTSEENITTCRLGSVTLLSSQPQDEWFIENHFKFKDFDEDENTA